MKRITILGSTGSIGLSTLEVIRQLPDKFRIVGLTTNANIDILYAQIREFKPAFICVGDMRVARDLKAKLDSKVKMFVGKSGLEEMIERDNLSDMVVVAISGSDALPSLLKAIDKRKDIALANKEALVMAGSIIARRVERKKVKIIPIDSEQSAIWQCLAGENKRRLRNIYLTASGGPFRKRRPERFKDISVEEVLRHPKWRMGEKISVDSATLMNKGLEILETMFLFGVELDKIKILIHPEAIIHSMVEFVDGIVLAQLSITDMRIPIQYALSYPQRLPNRLPSIDFLKLRRLNFQKPDLKNFPCLKLAHRVAGELGTMPCVLNAANEVSVRELLNKRLDFISLPRVIEKVLDRHKNIKQPNLKDILKADTWARQEAYSVIRRLNRQ